MGLPAGTRLGPYEVLAPLGAGGMGEVYRALDPRLHREVAVKLLAPAFALDATRLARFEREARLLASLQHPRIASVHGLEESDGRRFLVMELARGESLRCPSRSRHAADRGGAGGGAADRRAGPPRWAVSQDRRQPLEAAACECRPWIVVPS